MAIIPKRVVPGWEWVREAEEEYRKSRKNASDFLNPDRANEASSPVGEFYGLKASVADMFTSSERQAWTAPAIQNELASLVSSSYRSFFNQNYSTLTGIPLAKAGSDDYNAQMMGFFREYGKTGKGILEQTLNLSNLLSQVDATGKTVGQIYPGLSNNMTVREARNYLAEASIPGFMANAKRFASYGGNFAESVQEAALFAVQSIWEYDPNRGKDFQSWIQKKGLSASTSFSRAEQAYNDSIDHYTGVETEIDLEEQKPGSVTGVDWVDNILNAIGASGGSTTRLHSDVRETQNPAAATMINRRPRWYRDYTMKNKGSDWMNSILNVFQDALGTTRSSGGSLDLDVSYWQERPVNIPGPRVVTSHIGFSKEKEFSVPGYWVKGDALVEREGLFTPGMLSRKKEEGYEPLYLSENDIAGITLINREELDEAGSSNYKILQSAISDFGGTLIGAYDRSEVGGENAIWEFEQSLHPLGKRPYSFAPAARSEQLKEARSARLVSQDKLAQSLKPSRSSNRFEHYSEAAIKEEARQLFIETLSDTQNFPIARSASHWYEIETHNRRTALQNSPIKYKDNPVSEADLEDKSVIFTNEPLHGDLALTKSQAQRRGRRYSELMGPQVPVLFGLLPEDDPSPAGRQLVAKQQADRDRLDDVVSEFYSGREKNLLMTTAIPALNLRHARETQRHFTQSTGGVIDFDAYNAEVGAINASLIQKHKGDKAAAYNELERMLPGLRKKHTYVPDELANVHYRELEMGVERVPLEENSDLREAAIPDEIVERISKRHGFSAGSIRALAASTSWEEQSIRIGSLNSVFPDTQDAVINSELTDEFDTGAAEEHRKFNDAGYADFDIDRWERQVDAKKKAMRAKARLSNEWIPEQPALSFPDRPNEYGNVEPGHVVERPGHFGDVTQVQQAQIDKEVAAFERKHNVRRDYNRFENQGLKIAGDLDDLMAEFQPELAEYRKYLEDIQLKKSGNKPLGEKQKRIIGYQVAKRSRELFAQKVEGDPKYEDMLNYVYKESEYAPDAMLNDDQILQHADAMSMVPSYGYPQVVLHNNEMVDKHGIPTGKEPPDKPRALTFQEMNRLLGEKISQKWNQMYWAAKHSKNVPPPKPEFPTSESQHLTNSGSDSYSMNNAKRSSVSSSSNSGSSSFSLNSFIGDLGETLHSGSASDAGPTGDGDSYLIRRLREQERVRNQQHDASWRDDEYHQWNEWSEDDLAQTTLGQDMDTFLDTGNATELKRANARERMVARISNSRGQSSYGARTWVREYIPKTDWDIPLSEEKSTFAADPENLEVANRIMSKTLYNNYVSGVRGQYDERRYNGRGVRHPRPGTAPGPVRQENDTLYPSPRRRTSGSSGGRGANVPPPNSPFDEPPLPDEPEWDNSHFENLSWSTGGGPQPGSAPFDDPEGDASRWEAVFRQEESGDFERPENQPFVFRPQPRAFSRHPHAPLGGRGDPRPIKLRDYLLAQDADADFSYRVSVNTDFTSNIAGLFEINSATNIEDADLIGSFMMRTPNEFSMVTNPETGEVHPARLHDLYTTPLRERKSVIKTGRMQEGGILARNIASDMQKNYSWIRGYKNGFYGQGRLARDQGGDTVPVVQNEVGETISPSEIYRAADISSEAVSRAFSGPMPEGLIDMAATTKARLVSVVKESIKKDIAELERDGLNSSQARSKGERIQAVANDAADQVWEKVVRAAAGDSVEAKKAIDIARAATYKTTPIRQGDAKAIAENGLQRQIASTGYSAEYLSSLPEDQQVVFTQGTDAWSFQADKWGDKRGRKGGIWESAGAMGSVLYGAYLLKREWQMAAGPELASSQKYGMAMSELAGYGLTPQEAYSANAAASSYGFNSRQVAAEYAFSKGAYQQWGGMQDLAYLFSGNEGFNRMLSGLKVGAGVAGAGVIGAGTLSMMGVPALAAMATPVGWIGGVAGGTIAALSLGFEAYNSANKLTGDDAVSWGNIVDDVTRNAIREKVLGGIYEERKEKQQTLINPRSMSSLSPFLMSMINKDVGKWAFEQEFSDEELASVGVKEGYISAEAGAVLTNKATPPGVAAMDAIAEQLALEGIPVQQAQQYVANMKSTYGYVPTPETAGKLVRVSASAGMNVSGYLSMGERYAASLGYIPGTSAFNSAMDSIMYGTSSLQERHEMERQGLTYSQYGSQFQSYLGLNEKETSRYLIKEGEDGSAWYGMAEMYAGPAIAERYNIDNQQKAGKVMSLWSAFQEYGNLDLASADTLAMYSTQMSGAQASLASSFVQQAGRYGGDMLDVAGLFAGRNLTGQQMDMAQAFINGDIQGMSFYSQQMNIPGFSFFDKSGNSIIETNGAMALETMNHQQGSETGMYDFTGSNNQKINDAFAKGGIREVEKLAREDAYNSQIASLGVQASQIALSEQYIAQMNPLEDAQRELGYKSTYANFADQEARLRIREKYATSDENRNEARMNLSHGFNMWQMDFNYNSSLMQRGWAQEDWQYQDTNRSMSFGWQMEDINEAIRFSSGRERRQLIRQRERAITSHSLEDNQIEKTRNRQEEMWAQEDERYEKNRQYNVELMKLDKEAFSESKSQREELMKLDWQALERNRKEFEERKTIELEMVTIQREHQLKQIELQKAALGIQMDNITKQKEYADTIRNVQYRWKDFFGQFEMMNRYDGAFKFVNALQSLGSALQNTDANVVRDIAKILGGFSAPSYFYTANAELSRDDE